MRIRLPKPILPGGTAELDFDYRIRIPPDGAPRGGQDGEVYYISYWYPQMAVYDDVNGWQTDQYLGNAEFYMGYGNYDVALTVPAGWLVTGTGTLTNPGEVLSEPDPRAARLRPRAPRRSSTSSPRATGAGKGDRGGDRRQADLALQGRERPRRGLGRVGQLPVGRHQRRGRRRRRRRLARHRPGGLLLAPRDAVQPLGPGGALRPPLGRVPLQVSLALSLSPHDGGGRPHLVRRDGVPDDDLHRRPVGHARHVRGGGPRDRPHVAPDAGGLGREALRLDGRGVRPVRPVPGHARLLQGIRRRGGEPGALPQPGRRAAARSS